MSTAISSRTSGRKMLMFVLLIVLFSTAATLLAFAALRDTTVKVENDFTRAEVKVKVNERFSGSAKMNVNFTNTGDVPAFIRVKTVVNWLDSDGNVVMTVPDGHSYAVDGQTVDTTKLTKLADWTPQTAGKTGLTDGYWYYNHIVKPGETTKAFADLIVPIQPTGSAYSLQIHFLAEAIQAAQNTVDAPPVHAWVEEWKMEFASGSPGSWTPKS